MREACFCGRVGEVVDREPVYAGDGEWGLACPECGDLDRLLWLPEERRRQTLQEAARRSGARASTAGRPAPAGAPR